MPFETVEDAVRAIREADRDYGVLTVERVCGEALAQFPDSAVLWAYFADARLSRGDIESANDNLETALQKDPSCALAHAFKMRLHGFLAETELADQEADWLNNRPTLDIESRIFLSDHYALQGSNRALQIIEAVLRDFPDDFEALSREIGVLQLESKNDLAARKAKRFQTLFPQSGHTFLKMAREAARQKDYVEAERLFRIAVDRMPESSSAWAEMAMRLTFTDNWEEAENCAEQALSINSRSTLALRTLSLVADHNGDKEKAEEYRKQANQAIPSEACLNAMYEAGVLTKQGRNKEALIEIEKALTSPIRNTRIYALHIKVGIQQRRRNWPELEQALSQLEVEGDRSAVYYAGKVKVCLSRRQLQLAWDWVNEGLSKWPNSGDLRAEQVRLSHRYLVPKERYASLKEAVMVDYKTPAQAVLVIDAMLDCYQVEPAMLLLQRARDLFPEKKVWDNLEKKAKIRWNLRHGSVFDVSKNLSPVKKVLVICVRSVLKVVLTLHYGPPRHPK